MSFDAWLDLIEVPFNQHVLTDAAPLRERLITSPRLRSAIPLRLDVAVASWQGRRRFDADPSECARALEWSAAHIAGEPDPAAVESLARAALREQAIQEALKWRRCAPKRTKIVGLDELNLVRDGGRGALIVGLRLGPWYALPELLARSLGRVYLVVANDPQNRAPIRGRRARRKAVWRARAEHAGVRFVSQAAALEIAELLRRGMVAFTHVDFGDGRATTLLGRTFQLGADASELAFAADVPVFPALIVRRGGRLHAELLPRLEPRRDWTPEELHARIAAALDPALRTHVAELYPNALWTAEQAAERAARAERKRARRADRLLTAATPHE